MVVKKTLFNTAYRLSEGWLIFSVIFMIHYFFFGSQHNSYLSETISVLFVAATIGTIPFAILKFIKKGMEKKSIGHIQ